MFDPQTMPIYLAIADVRMRSRMEDQLVLDGFRVGAFSTVSSLWDHFRTRPARMVMADRRFPDGFSALDLARAIRKDFLLPYVYIVVMSTMGNLKEISEGLSAGVDDYLVKPPNPLQLRTRTLVGQRWLNYIDSLSNVQA